MCQPAGCAIPIIGGTLTKVIRTMDQKLVQGGTMSKGKSQAGRKSDPGMTSGAVYRLTDDLVPRLKEEADWPEICERARTGDSVDAEWLLAILPVMDGWASLQVRLETLDWWKALLLALDRLEQEYGCFIRLERLHANQTIQDVYTFSVRTPGD